MTIKLGEKSNISVVNFGPFLDGSDKQGVADAILESFQQIGFVYLVNHGLEKQKIEGMFETVRLSRSDHDLTAVSHLTKTKDQEILQFTPRN